MSSIPRGKNNGALFLFILAGIVIGGFISELTAGIPALGWLNYGQTFGLPTPIELTLGVIIIQFGLTIKITIGSIVGIIIAAVLYRFV